MVFITTTADEDPQYNKSPISFTDHEPEDVNKLRSKRVNKLAKRINASENNILHHKNLIREIKYEIRGKVLYRTFKTSFSFIPKLIWAFFSEAFIVASFRNEWASKYRSWSAWLAIHNEAVQLSDTLFALPAVTSSVALHANRRLSTRRKTIAKVLRHRQTIADQADPFHIQKHNHQLCSRIKINVGGRIFETQVRTLQRYPHTLLGDPHRRLPFYDPLKEHYYFDRSRDHFEYILYFYQSGGRVICPPHLLPDEFLSEVEFFDLGYDAVRGLKLEAGEADDDEDEDQIELLPKNLLQRKLWLLMEYPTSSPQATLISIISVYVVLVSVISFCIETVPMLKNRDHPWFKDNDSPYDDEFESISPTDPLAMVETLCVTWFTLELLLRFLTSPIKYNFCVDLMNIIDLLAIIPFAVGWIDILSTGEDPEDPSGTHKHLLNGLPAKEQNADVKDSLEVVRIFRLIRVFRIFKLSRHVKGLKILGWTLRASLNELMLLIFFLVICVILFSSAVYFAEDDSEDAGESLFISIPHSAYWAVTTMTTVGYGDIVPKQAFGKVIGSLCAIAGVLTLALPMPVMVSNFNYFYNQELNKIKSATEKHDNVHVQMCPYLPNNGKHPDLVLFEETRKALANKRLGSSLSQKSVNSDAPTPRNSLSHFSSGNSPGTAGMKPRETNSNTQAARISSKASSRIGPQKGISSMGPSSRGGKGAPMMPGTRRM